MTPRHLFAAAVLTCGLAAAPAQADIIMTTGLAGGSGGVSNVIFNACGLGSSTGTTVQGCLNTNHDTRVNFTSTEELTIGGGGQATITATDGFFDNVMISFADATLGFTKLQFNLDAVADGTATFQGVDQFGATFDFVFDLDGNGQNFFTVEAINGQVATSFSLLSTVGIQNILDLEQVRVGSASLVPVPGPASLALFGTALMGLGLVRRRRGVAA